MTDPREIARQIQQEFIERNGEVTASVQLTEAIAQALTAYGDQRERAGYAVGVRQASEEAADQAGMAPDDPGYGAGYEVGCEEASQRNPRPHRTGTGERS